MNAKGLHAARTIFPGSSKRYGPCVVTNRSWLIPGLIPLALRCDFRQTQVAKHRRPFFLLIKSISYVFVNVSKRIANILPFIYFRSNSLMALLLKKFSSSSFLNATLAISAQSGTWVKAVTQSTYSSLRSRVNLSPV